MWTKFEVFATERILERFAQQVKTPDWSSDTDTLPPPWSVVNWREMLSLDALN